MRAVDADDPSAGHKFFFSLAPEGTYRSNFTIRDNGGKNKIKLLEGFTFNPLRCSGLVMKLLAKSTRIA